MHKTDFLKLDLCSSNKAVFPLILLLTDYHFKSCQCPQCHKKNSTVSMTPQSSFKLNLQRSPKNKSLFGNCKKCQITPPYCTVQYIIEKLIKPNSNNILILE